jgi:hypothetical protein
VKRFGFFASWFVVRQNLLCGMADALSWGDFA